MQQKTTYRIYVIAFIATSLLWLVFMLLNQRLDGSCWQTMQQSKSALTAEYCELDQSTHFFRQTMNTYSNLMYFFLGMIVVLVGLYDKKNKKDITTKNSLQQFPLLSLLFGICLMYLCIGSAFFHASLTWIGQRIDMNGTYSICIVLIGISIYRYFAAAALSKRNQWIIIIALIIAIIIFIELHLLISSLVLLPLLILAIVVFTVLNYTKHKNSYKLSLAVLSLTLMIGAYILRNMDVKKIACDPVSLYQGHALWHFFTGMSAFMLYWFYRSEQV